jgi:transposase
MMEMAMASDELFDDLAEALKPERPEAGRAEPRVLRPERRQVVLRAVDLDSLLPADHLARLVWEWVESQDLTALYEAIEARGSLPGRPAIDPRILLALWLFALSESVGSAREIARLCERDLPYMWLCGDVRVNYHALSDLRSDHPELVDRLLTMSVMGLMSQGLVQLDRLSVDGVRVRANAGQASFRRRASLERLEAEAQAHVAGLKQDIGAGPAASQRRAAAVARAARQRAERIAKAKEVLAEREAERDRRKRTEKKKSASQGGVRASTTDPQARVMKMADGGFRPAYNVQVTSDPKHGIIVATGLDTTGSDRGLLARAIAGIEPRYGRAPCEVLADGGFFAAGDIETLAAQEPPIIAYVPITQSKHGTDPYAARPDDGPGVKLLRQRMASEPGKAIYKERSPTELPHARLRHTGLVQFRLRGATKALIEATWHALVNNLIIAFGWQRRQAMAAA